MKERKEELKMKMTDQNAVEIFKKGGVVAASDWKTGSGNFVSSRPVPQKCIKIEVTKEDPHFKTHGLCGEARKAIYRLLFSRPKVRKLIVVKDWDEVKELAWYCAS
jgi:hypothetical protein